MVPSDNKYKARLNCINHTLERLTYEKIPFEPVKLPKRDKARAYDDKASMADRRYIPEKY